MSTYITENPGVSIIAAVSNLANSIRLFTNYVQQHVLKKELIIIVYNNLEEFEQWVTISRYYPMVRVYQLNIGTSIDQCYNYGIERSIFQYVTLFQEELDYAPGYLSVLIEKSKNGNTNQVGNKIIL